MSYKSPKTEILSMYNDELIEAAKQLNIENFIGVFALNRLPPSLTHYAKPLSFIVNTDTANLSGEHWIAVHFSNLDVIQAFDPLGVFYPVLLSNYLAKRGRRVIFNRVTYQDPTRRTCGQHCLRWLSSINTRYVCVFVYSNHVLILMFTIVLLHCV